MTRAHCLTPLAFLVLLVWSATVPANETWYLGIDAARWTYDPPFEDEYRGGAPRLRGGVQGPGHTSLELQYVPSFDDTRGGIEVDFDYIAGVYLKWEYQVTRRLSGLLLTGFARHPVTIDDPQDGITDNDDDGLSGGIGLNVRVDERHSARLDYMFYSNRVDLLSIGVTRAF